MLAASIFIIYFHGRAERTHPEAHNIHFDTVLAQPDDITCGPTSAAMVLHHYGNKGVSVEEVKAETCTVWFKYGGKDIGMTSPDYIARALRKLGVPSSMKCGNIDTLKHHVAQDRPCIVLVRSGETTWHYFVVYGFTEGKLQIADPSGGQLYEMTSETFLGCWSWATDTEGIACDNQYLPRLLTIAEVHPFTYIVPDDKPPSAHR